MKKILAICICLTLFVTASVFTQETDESALLDTADTAAESDEAESEPAEEVEPEEAEPAAEVEPEQVAAELTEVADEAASKADEAANKPKATAADSGSDKWGLGLYWRGIGGSALTLKAPKVPIYWSIYCDFYDLQTIQSSIKEYKWWRVGLSADWYFLDKIPERVINLLAGLGGYVDYAGWESTHYNTPDDSQAVVNQGDVGLGLRVLIGLSWRPANVVEVFLSYAPSLGLGIRTGDARKGDSTDLQYNIANGECGLRFWF